MIWIAIAVVIAGYLIAQAINSKSKQERIDQWYEGLSPEEKTKYEDPPINSEAERKLYGATAEEIERADAIRKSWQELEKNPDFQKGRAKYFRENEEMKTRLGKGESLKKIARDMGISEDLAERRIKRKP